MKKRKLAGLFLCFALALGVALPITMAIPTYADGSSAEKDEMVVIATGSVPSKSENSGESKKSSGSSKNVEIATAPNVATAPNATKPTSGGVVHIDTCLEGCTGEDCACPCHKKSLFERIMETETLDEFESLIFGASDEELETLTDEQVEIINQHLSEIEPDLLPATEVGECSDEPVPSEIVYVTVNFTNAAPIIGAGK